MRYRKRFKNILQMFRKFPVAVNLKIILRVQIVERVNWLLQVGQLGWI